MQLMEKNALGAFLYAFARIFSLQQTLNEKKGRILPFSKYTKLLQYHGKEERVRLKGKKREKKKNGNQTGVDNLTMFLFI